MQQDAMQQPAGANKGGGLMIDTWGGGVTKGDARWRRCDKMQHDNQPGNKGNQEEKWTRGGGLSQGRGSVLRE